MDAVGIQLGAGPLEPREKGESVHSLRLQSGGELPWALRQALHRMQALDHGPPGDTPVPLDDGQGPSSSQPAVLHQADPIHQRACQLHRGTRKATAGR